MQNANRLNVNSYHGQKRQLLGTNGPPPAWRTNVNSSVPQNTVSNGRKPSTSVKQSSEGGSKILISRLPQDVTDKEIVELFNKTVGPTKDAFLIHNNKGQPKGMAIVVFQRTTDAEVARTKFDGKIVDGKKPLKIELIVDSNAETTLKNATTTPSPQVPSLLERMGVTSGTKPTQQKQLKPEPASATAGKPKPQPTKRRSRTRKGPARLKRRAVSAQDLDREMEEYRAAVPPTNNNFIIFPPKSELMMT